MDRTSEKQKKSKGLSTWVILIGIFIAAFPVLRTRNAWDPIHYIYPNFLLFTPYRNTTREYWEKNIVIDKAVIREPTHIPEIYAQDFSYNALKAATDGFRHPAVVRGFFNGTPAMTKWITVDYFPSRLGKFNVPVVHEALVGKLQNNRSVQSFADAFGEIITNEHSKSYLFFPVKSRFNFNGSDLGSIDALQNEVNAIVREDLELDRIWKGFGTKSHKSYHGSQLIIGQGSDDIAQTTGTGWHCAAGNNWFVQVKNQ
jgi:hypothetical protein